MRWPSSPCCFHPVGNAPLRPCSLSDEAASSPPAVRACMLLLLPGIIAVEMPLAAPPLLPVASSDDGPATAGPLALRAAAATTTPALRVRRVRHKHFCRDAIVMMWIRYRDVAAGPVSCSEAERAMEATAAASAGQGSQDGGKNTGCNGLLWLWYTCCEMIEWVHDEVEDMIGQLQGYHVGYRSQAGVSGLTAASVEISLPFWTMMDQQADMRSTSTYWYQWYGRKPDVFCFTAAAGAFKDRSATAAKASDAQSSRPRPMRAAARLAWRRSCCQRAL